MARRDDVSRDLLLGLLALQNGMVTRDQLVAAFGAWTGDPDRALADRLADQVALGPDERGLLRALVDNHLRRHGGDPERSLAALDVNPSTRESLARAGGPDVEATLCCVHPGSAAGCATDADRTATYAVGTATADGQRFRVLRPHARGGLGAVFVALDSELNREVALKQILDHHADDPVSRQRFLIEAEITGGLEHPGIVPVYGLGTYGDGRPYYAMRFVRGDSLKEAIARFHAEPPAGSDRGLDDSTPAARTRELERRRLLRRFLDVCNAIDYAHSRGVLHRDIKPGNVIVGRHGETLVVDWGLAKPLGRAEVASPDERPLAPSSASGSADTLPGSALGTPAYMSPEQARGDLEALGPRSDVYSLGATLYCLLTGKPPFEGDDAGAVLGRVQRGEFPPPRRLDPALDRALEAVCLKAMALRPGDRYATCRALADDVERWMADEPVSAWREPWTRTLLRWLTRHRTGVTAAAAAVLVALAGTAAVLAVQTRANAALRAANARVTLANVELKAANAREAARLRLALDAIKVFHGEVSEDLLLKEKPFAGLRAKLLKGAADFYERLGGMLKDQPDRASRAGLARAYAELGNLTYQIGELRAALDVQGRALEIRRDLASGSGADPGAALDLARSLLDVGQTRSVTGDKRGALEAIRAARRTVEGLDVPGPAGDRARAVLAKAHFMIGWTLESTGDMAEALASYRRASALQAALAAAHPADPAPARDLAATRNAVANLLTMTGRWPEALDECRRCLDGLKAYPDAAASPNFRHEEGLAYNILGYALVSMGRPGDAVEPYARGLAIRRGLVELYPTSAISRRDLAQSYMNIGLLQLRLLRPAEAVDSFRPAAALLDELARENPTVTEFRHFWGFTLGKLGVALFMTGATAEGLASCRRGVAVLEDVAAANPSEPEVQNALAVAWSDVGSLLSRAGATAEALESYRRSLAVQQGVVAANPSVSYYARDLFKTHSDAGLLLLRAGRAAEAADHFGRAADIVQRLADERSTLPGLGSALANARANAAAALLASGRAAEARDQADRAAALRRARLAADPNSAEDRAGLGEALLRSAQARQRTGDAAGAAGAARESLAAFAALPPRVRTSEPAFLEGCARAVLSDLAGRAGSGVPAADAGPEAAAALRLLRTAAATDFADPDVYRVETALEPLRGREDFRLLMLDLAVPAEPFAR